jgi:hypothetical protein
MLLLVMIAGCARVGPASITNGRSIYNEVLNKTSDEQVLNMLVKIRYEETYGMLMVSNVTANIKVRTTVGAQFGFGTERSYDGNLVPLSVGAAYEENPTISYYPRRGETFVRAMLMPLPLDALVLFGRSTGYRQEVGQIVIRELNGIRNPIFGSEKEAEEFKELIRTIYLLKGEGSADIVLAGDPPTLSLVLYEYGDHIDKVRRGVELLGLDEVDVNGEDIVLPVRRALARRRADGLNIEMRSLYEVMQLFGAGIDVPAEHLEAGIVARDEHPASEPFLVVRSSKERPANAMVAVSVHDWWFYVEASDIPSKRAFRFLQALIGMQLEQEFETKQAAPVLTVPVG